MIPKIKAIQKLDNYRLLITFDNNVTKEYDCKTKFAQRGFELLKDISFFNLVRIDTGGYGISWNDNIDISEYELWTEGKEIALSKN